jgi:hypothetical protein
VLGVTAQLVEIKGTTMHYVTHGCVAPKGVEAGRTKIHQHEIPYLRDMNIRSISPSYFGANVREYQGFDLSLDVTSSVNTSGRLARK